MSYFSDYWQKSSDSKKDHEKVWKRSKATLLDAPWQAMSAKAREAYLSLVKPAIKESSTVQPGTSLDLFPAGVVDELVQGGFVRTEPGSGKRVAKVFAMPKTFDFSARVRAAQRYHLLGPLNLEGLLKFVRYAFLNQGETLILRILNQAGIKQAHRLEDGLENYVTSRKWPIWIGKSSASKVVPLLVEALSRVEEPIPIDRVPSLLPPVKPSEVMKALDELIANLAVFEDVDPGSFQLVVGLLPIVRERMIEGVKPRTRPPLVVCEHPREFGPTGGLFLNDLRIFLLEVAGEPPRLRQDSAIFQSELDRFESALPEWPGWLSDTYDTAPDLRIGKAYSYARLLQFVRNETEDKRTVLQLSGKGRKWLAAGIHQQYDMIFELYREPTQDNMDGDARFLGLSVQVAPAKSTASLHSYYYLPDLKPEARRAQRKFLEKLLARLPIGVYHVWQSVLDHMVYGDDNPLTQGRDPESLVVYLNRRQVPSLPENLDKAGKLVVDMFLQCRLLAFDAFQAAIDDQGRLCVARLRRFDGYFGNDYPRDETTEATATRVIIQPDFSVIVIGIDPGPAAELAPFCERSRGHLGEGAITFRITRESVTRAAAQGLSGSAISNRLKKHASLGIPDNVLKEIQEWAGSIRQVNIDPITVVRCPNSETADRVMTALGKKSERLSPRLVSLSNAKLTTAERERLREQGIIVTKDRIEIDEPTKAISDEAKPGSTTKKRGRPKKSG